MARRMHTLTTIMAVALFVMALPQQNLPAQEGPEDLLPDPFSPQAIAAAPFHLELAFATGATVLPVRMFGTDYPVAQLRLEPALRGFWYLDDAWTLGLGVGGSFSFDSTSAAALSRPGASTFLADLSFGWMPRPAVDSSAVLGWELRQSAHYGAINDTQLYTFWLRTSLRPRLRLGGLHFEVATPVAIAWRNDPAPAFEFGLELGFVL